MPVGQRIDPYRNFRFRVEIDGITQAGFLECLNLGSSTDVIEYREGTDPTTTRKLTGLTKYSNIILRWGITDSMELMNWRKAIINGNIQRRNISIILLDEMGNEKVRWNISEAWPCVWIGPSLNARGQEVAIDELQIAYERIELESSR